MIGRDDIRAAYARIKPHVRRTPVLRTNADDFGVTLSYPLTFKLEFLEHTGTFKPRGAFNNLLSRAVPPSGVAAASGGNHGAAVAYAAQRLGHKATIFVPDVSSPVKIARIKSYGADVRVGGARYADALDACNTFIAGSGALSGREIPASLCSIPPRRPSITSRWYRMMQSSRHSICFGKSFGLRLNLAVPPHSRRSFRAATSRGSMRKSEFCSVVQMSIWRNWLRRVHEFSVSAHRGLPRLPHRPLAPGAEPLSRACRARPVAP